MNIDVFNEALELRNKQILCEDLMRYLSDPEAVKGLKYKTLLAKFASEFKSEFMMFVHTMGVKAGEAFEELHDCCPECGCNGTDDNIGNPPEDAKFQSGDRVTVIGGSIAVYKGRIGTVEAYDYTEPKYGVRIDGFSTDALLLWFAEDELEPYIEAEESTPKFKDGDIVRILSGESKGKLAKIVYCDDSDGSYRVEFLDDGATGSMWYQEDELELYTETDDNDDDEATD